MAYKIYMDLLGDLSEEILRDIPEVVLIPMNVVLDGEPRIYGPGGDLTVKELYTAQRGGKFANTSQINSEVYREYFKKALDSGMDVLYVACSSGLSGTYQSSCIAAEDLREEYPERKIYCIDSRSASVGMALMVHALGRRQQEGWDIDRAAAWIQDNIYGVQHWFTVDVFEHLKHGGRVSGAAAAIGTLLSVKPMLLFDKEGKLKVVEKPRGRKVAMRSMTAHFVSDWKPEVSNLVVIAHGDDPEAADQLKAILAEQKPEADIRTAYVGPAIGAHTGPGMLAVVFWGENR